MTTITKIFSDTFGDLPKEDLNPIDEAGLLVHAQEFLFSPSHAVGKRIVEKVFRDFIIFERTNVSGAGEFYKRNPGQCFYEPFPDVRMVAGEILEAAVDLAFCKQLETVQGREVTEVYSKAGRAKVRTRTRDFLAGVLSLYSDAVLVYPAIPWNESQECISTLTEIIDFTGKEPIARPPKEKEYFRNPAPCSAEQVLTAGVPVKFFAYLETLFSCTDTMKAGLDCLALCIAGKAVKTFQIWTNAEGDGGKNTLYDLIRLLIPGRVFMAKNALILYKGSDSERRFGEIGLQGRSAVFFDEVGGAFDIAQIKRYTSLSTIRGEAKGRDSVEFSQTWAMIALCNSLPVFFPANDGGFLSRLFILPFDKVFYTDARDKRLKLDRGIPENRLLPCMDKERLLDEILEERPGIIFALILDWIEARDTRRGKPFPADECLQAAEVYRQDNDTAEKFFSEYLKRHDGGAVPYETIKGLWQEFTGKNSVSMRDVVKTLTGRFPWIGTVNSNSMRKITNVSLKEG